METIHLSYPLKTEETFPPISLAIGYFAGVHRGHQAVIQRARKIAADLGVISGVMTFYPHPRDVLGKAKVNQYLTPLPDKLAQFERLGVERVYVMRFDRELAARSKESFVEDVLLPLQVKGVTVGFNFTFGRGAKGKAEDLATLGAGRLQVEVVRPIQHQALSVSSNRLRQALDSVRSDYDFILIDCPPSLSMLTVNALAAAHGVLIPMQCEYYALEGLSALLDTIQGVQRGLNPELDIEGLLRTMYDPRSSLTREVSSQLVGHFGDRVYRTAIPRNVRLAEAPSFGRPVMHHDRRSRGALAYLALAGELLRRGDAEADAAAQQQ